MKTIKELRDSINVEELRNIENIENSKNPRWAITSTDEQLVSTELYMLIWKRFKAVSTTVDTKEVRKGVVLNKSYYITFDNEEVLNTLRQLYISTKNGFVKKVIETVGKSKKASEKQLETIIEEMMKFNLNINF